MTVPIIDGIDHETFEYHSVYQDHQHFRGIFEWGMLYKVGFIGFYRWLYLASYGIFPKYPYLIQVRIKIYNFGLYFTHFWKHIITLIYHKS